LSQPQPHNEFLELCAIATSGQLSAEEQRRLQNHLDECPSCREVMHQYEAIAGKIIPALAPEFLAEPSHDASNWSENRAEAALFARLEREEQNTKSGPKEPHDRDQAPSGIRPLFHSAGEVIWRHVWMQYAAGVLLVIALGISIYQLGLHRGVETAGTPARPPIPNQLALEQLSDAGHERQVLKEQDQQRERLIADLRRQLDAQSAETSRLKNEQLQLQSEIHDGTSGTERLTQERTDLEQRLNAAQNRANMLENRLDSLARQSSQDAARTKELEGQLAVLTAHVKERDDTIDQQQELLAHDRDIRELMGARDLYIAEVYDVAGTGATKKPYGRVFYTKGKSLIFYAYDLDQQRELKNASTFQAWGSRGTNWKQAQSLGIFYEDSAAKKRWVLRFDDPRTLAQIDTVFVTVEPSGGSHKPSGQRLLFAYLKIDPNHP
jgi:Putative zinc-finger